MSENKFIRHLQGKDTAKSVLEIRNQKTPTSFANMPDGTSNANDVYSDRRGDAAGVLKGTENWKLNGSTLLETSTVYGDGRDFTDDFEVNGSGLWVNATYTFATAKRFAPNTKFVLKLCGHDLDTVAKQTVGFTLIVKFGSTVITKVFSVPVQAFDFCKEFEIDFGESNTDTIKVGATDTMQVQLLCADPDASATIYNGITVFTALQRRVDGETVASDKKTFDEVVQDIDDINEEIDDIHEDIDDLEDYVDDNFVRLDGNSIMTAPLKFMSGSVRGAVGPYFNGVGFWKLDSQGNLTQIASISDSQFIPTTTSAIDIGNSTKKWKDLYLGGKAYVATLNNGADLTVPNKTGTLATMGDVELAARSGRMLTDQGVWYAKMYSATVPPAAENGTNYADFSQVDGDNNPIIVIYERQSGAWVQTETITPPAEYDGYVPITSKIWDIAEQSGQQGGRILWNHISKEFTPYPTIISFEDIEITGTSTVIMPLSPTSNQIVNKDYVDSHIPTVGNGTITLTQGGTTKGTFTTNQSGNTTIDLDAGGAGGYHPDLFDWKWADSLRNDVQWLRADTFSWQDGSVYKAAYKHLRNDMFIWASWDNNGTTIYTKKRYPEVGEKAYSNSSLTTELGEITAIADSLSAEQITVNGVVYDMLSGSNIAPTTETIAGVTVQYIPAEDGHKIVKDLHTFEVEAVYAATGIAWYYIIDTVSAGFRLPRSKHNKYAATFGVVGNGIGIGLTNGTDSGVFGERYDNGAANFSGLSSVTLGTVVGKNTVPSGASFPNGVIGLTTDPEKSGIIAQQDQDTDQYKYLYFYVGNFTQTALENTAGLNAELFNGKADTDLSNVLANIDFVVASQLPTAGNNYTWYRKYKSGWVEQGGHYTHNNVEGTVTTTLAVTMADTHYNLQITKELGSDADPYTGYQFISSYVNNSKTTTTFQVRMTAANRLNGYDWQVSGMAA